MPVYELEDARRNGSAAVEPATRRHPSAHNPHLINDLRAELDGYLGDMQGFANNEPDEVLRSVSSMGARAAQIRQTLARFTDRQVRAFISAELDPFIGQCEFQFRVHSRLMAQRQLDWDMARGQ